MDAERQYAIQVIGNYLQSPGFGPRQGNDAAQRYVELTLAEQEAPPALEKMFDEWLDKQKTLWDIAQSLVETLENIYPTPTDEQVLRGDAVFAPWHDKEWWVVLRFFPVAAGLEDAIHEAEAAIEAHES